MARCDIQMPDDFLKKLQRLGDREDTIAEAALKAGGEVVLERVRGNLAAAIGKTKYPSHSTGELSAALGLSTVRTDRDGNHNIKVGFAEPRLDGGSNARIANILEYGRHGQPAKPFLKPAKAAARASAIEAMQRTLEEEVEKL